MDEAHLHCAFRYVALNPVRAGLVTRAQDWPWSSARAQLGLGEDGLTELESLRVRVPDFAALLAEAEDQEASLRLRRAETIGRPLGSAAFLKRLEADYDRVLRAARPGPRPAGKLSALSP